MNRMGRPRLPAEERLAHGIGVPVTLAQYEEVLRLSKSRGLSMSAFVREALMEKLERVNDV
jgi:hypothetical protein